MTQKQFQKKCIDLLRSCGPDSEKRQYGGDYIQHNDPRGPVVGVEYEFKNGLRVHLMFAHRSKFGTRFHNWVHFGLIKLGEDVGRKLASEPFYCWWKWNIHASGDAQQQRDCILAELERRIKRCEEFKVLKTSLKGTTP